MARVWAAEKALQAARRAASKAFEAAGKDTEGMFAESAFVPRRTAETMASRRQRPRLQQPPKLAVAAREARAFMERDHAPKLALRLKWPIMRNSGCLDAVQRSSRKTPRRASRAVVGDASTHPPPKQRAKMIVAAAAKGVRLPKRK